MNGCYSRLSISLLFASILLGAVHQETSSAQQPTDVSQPTQLSPGIVQPESGVLEEGLLASAHLLKRSGQTAKAATIFSNLRGAKELRIRLDASRTLGSIYQDSGDHDTANKVFNTAFREIESTSLDVTSAAIAANLFQKYTNTLTTLGYPTEARSIAAKWNEIELRFQQESAVKSQATQSGARGRGELAKQLKEARDLRNTRNRSAAFEAFSNIVARHRALLIDMNALADVEFEGIESLGLDTGDARRVELLNGLWKSRTNGTSVSMLAVGQHLAKGLKSSGSPELPKHLESLIEASELVLHRSAIESTERDTVSNILQSAMFDLALIFDKSGNHDRARLIYNSLMSRWPGGVYQAAAHELERAGKTKTVTTGARVFFYILAIITGCLFFWKYRCLAKGGA